MMTNLQQTVRNVKDFLLIYIQCIKECGLEVLVTKLVLVPMKNSAAKRYTTIS